MREWIGERRSDVVVCRVDRGNRGDTRLAQPKNTQLADDTRAPRRAGREPRDCGIAGGLQSLEGAVLALAVLLPVVFLRGLGGGDWKLMGALGAWLGPGQVLMILLVTIFLSGLLALVQIIRAKRFLATVRNVWELLRGFFIFGLQPHPEINLDNPTALTLPFGAAAALATLACFWIGWHGQ